MYVSAIVI
ncbi:hypothetical protein OIU79_030225, partial [Salix purpurea]